MLEFFPKIASRFVTRAGRGRPWIALAVAITLFAGVSTALAQTRVQGIDVSEFQGAMNWTTAYNAGVRFTFIRATRGPASGTGSGNDIRTTTNVPAARAAGILAGVYHYARPDLIAVATGQPTTAALTASAQSEALHLYHVAKNYMLPGYLRPVLDLEERGGPDDGTTALTPASLSFWATTFSNEIQRLANTRPLVYMNTNFASNYVNSTMASQDLWVANWNQTTYGAPLGTGSPPTGTWGTNGKTWSFWQYSADGNGKGAEFGASSSAIDLDVARGDINFVRSFLVPEPGTAAGLAVLAAAALARRRRRGQAGTRFAGDVRTTPSPNGAAQP